MPFPGLEKLPNIFLQIIFIYDQSVLSRIRKWTFVDVIVEAITNELRDAEWRKGVGRKFDISAPVEKLLSIMTVLEALDRESEPPAESVSATSLGHFRSDGTSVQGCRERKTQERPQHKPLQQEDFQGSRRSVLEQHRGAMTAQG